MALTIDANLAGKIVSTNALEAFTKLLCPLNAFTTSFDNEAGQVGDRIEIPFVTQFGNNGSTTVGAFNASSNNYSTAGTTDIDAVQVSLGNHQKTTWGITDFEAAEYQIAQLERFGSQKGNDLATKIFTDVTGLMTSGNFSNNTAVGAANAFTLDELLDARAKIVARGANPADCSVLLGSGHFNALLGDARFSADAYGGAEAIRQGVIPSLAGFRAVYECPNIASGASVNGVIAHPNAIAVAFRYLQPTEGGASAYTRTDRLTNEYGMTMGYRQYYEPQLGKSFATLEAVYGFSVVDGNALERLTTS